MVITTPYANAGYSVENGTGDILCSGNMTARNPGVFVGVDSPIVSSQYSDRQKQWHMYSSSPVPISVLYTSQDSTSFSAYLAYPCDSIQDEEYEYFGISVSSSGSHASQIVLIACTNDSVVTVTPTEDIQFPLDTQDPTSPTTNITSGDTSHPITLHFGQTLPSFQCRCRSRSHRNSNHFQQASDSCEWPPVCKCSVHFKLLPAAGCTSSSNIHMGN